MVELTSSNSVSSHSVEGDYTLSSNDGVSVENDLLELRVGSTSSGSLSRVDDECTENGLEGVTCQDEITDDPTLQCDGWSRITTIISSGEFTVPDGQVSYSVVVVFVNSVMEIQDTF